ncbi:MAG: molybdenum cofactor guanylyltransferase [Planctomycetia bacterium]
MSAGVIGIVLAGGSSRRMQPPAGGPLVRKALLAPGGMSLLARVVAAVAAEVDRVIVVAAPDMPLPELPGRPLVVRDSLPGAGPLAGLADGLRAAALSHGGEPAPLAVVVSCDVPLVRRDVLRLLIDRAREGGAMWTVPLVGGHRQVLVSVVQVGLLGRIESWLAAGRRDLRGLIDDMAATDAAVAIVPEAEIIAVDPRLESFLDVDTPGDFDRVRRQLPYGESDH